MHSIRSPLQNFVFSVGDPEVSFHSAKSFLFVRICTKTKKTYVLQARAGAAAKSAAIKYDLSFLSGCVLCRKHLPPLTRALSSLVSTKNILFKFSWKFPLLPSPSLIYWVLFSCFSPSCKTAFNHCWSMCGGTEAWFLNSTHYFQFAAVRRPWWWRDQEEVCSSKLLIENITCILLEVNLPEQEPGKWAVEKKMWRKTVWESPLNLPHHFSPVRSWQRVHSKSRIKSSQ